MSPPASGSIRTRSPRATQQLARRIAASLAPGDVIALTGELGAGKTCFVQGLVKALPGGAALEPRSPTFSLMNAYPTRPPVYHFDFYRLADADDLETTGYWDCVQAGDGIVVVEWADRIPMAIPAAAIRIRVWDRGAGERQFTIEDGRPRTDDR